MGKFFLSITLILFCFSASLYSQDNDQVYDEVLVLLEVPRIGSFDIPSVIKGQELFLPVKDLFDLMKIRNVPSRNMESVSGFFISPEAEYLISYTDKLIRYQGKTHTLEDGCIVRTENDLYLRTDYFGKIFGIDCNFNFRSLSVKLDSKLELPMIREMRQQEMRDNISKLKGEIKADTVIKRTYPAFRFGTADWTALTSQEKDGKNDTRLNLALGAMIAGGEATASLNYNNIDGFRERQQNYLWRYVDNDFNIFRQILVGKIATQSTSSLFNPVIGVQVTNTPTTYRRSFGTYTLTDRTEPDWVVELYVNNVLIDYVKADASGFFKFEVPLVYGNSIIQLKFFGPWGEERVREQNINIPFSFLPEGTFEYRISAGIVEDTSMSRFSRASFNYGLTRHLTLGAGLEYLSSVASGPAMPYVNASWSIMNNLLLSGEYAYGVRSKGTVQYRFPSNMNVELNYTKYDKGQTAIMYNYLEERKASLSLPVRIGGFSSYHRLSVYQIIVPQSEYLTGEWLFTGSFAGISTNLTTSAIFLQEIKPNFYSNISLSFRVPGNIYIRPQAQYGYSKNELITWKLGLEKYIRGRAFINLAYEENLRNNLKMAELGFRYNFSFAQTGASVRRAGSKTSFIEYARGSLIYDKKTRYFGGDDQSNVGRGGISVIPYLDLNANGHRDPGEPKASGLNLRSNGGHVEVSAKDTTLRILGLEPYTSYFLDLDPSGFENISWRLPVKTFSVAVDPNILKHIEIPVSVVGEASGMVTINKQNESSGQGRIIVNFNRLGNKTLFSTLTEDDGYFSYFGLAPGEYQVSVDSAQLLKLGMTADPRSIKFNVRAGLDGDVIDGLDFALRMLTTDTVQAKVITEVKPVIKKDTSYLVVHEVVQELQTITTDSWAIQLGAFKNRNNAENLRRNLEKLLNRKVEIIVEDDFFKVRIGDIKDRNEVDAIIPVLQKNGITELWVIALKAKQQQLVLVEKRDSVRTITETIVPPDTLALKSKPEIAGKIFMSFGKNFYKLDIPEAPVIESDLVRVIRKNRPSGKLTDKKSWIRPIDIPLVKEAPEEKRDIFVPGKAGGMLIPSVYVNPDLYLAPPGAGKVKAPVITLQVGVFYKKAQAVKARKKIMSKLNLPVQIVQQWEYYRVIITGFTTKEETYQYYPELAGLGFPGVKLIQE